MLSVNDRPALPLELILSVIECLIPAEPVPVALPPSHPTTKTLLSLARTSSITYPDARRLLYTHCLCIDDTQRLIRLNASLHLGNFVCVLPRTRPNLPIVQHMSSLYLSYPAIEQRGLATNVLDLFTVVAPYLRHLVVDMPFRNFDAGDALDTQAVLRRAFSKLTALETFCSVRDELYLDLFNPAHNNREHWLWSIWPKLKTLALYNKDVSADGFWADIATLEGLETLVFTRADGLEEVDMKAEWRRHCGDEKRALDILLVDVQSGHREPLGKVSWTDRDKVHVREVNVPTSYYGDESPIWLCQEWVRRRMVRGEAPVEWR